MFGIEHFIVFLITGLLLNITPGNDTIYILSRTITQGKKAGIMSVMGIVSGAILHTLSAALGLSIILMKSALIFNIIKWLGAGYLVYLGIKIVLTKAKSTNKFTTQEKVVLRKIYSQGLLTNLLNPKVALFYLAFLPQFISQNNEYGLLPFILLGLTFITTGTIWCLMLVAFAHRWARKIRESWLSRYLDKITGVIFIALGINLLRSTRV